MDRHIFGICADGTPVERVELSGGGLRMNLLSWGCVVQDLRLDDHEPPLVLGFEQFEHYERYSPYMGATVGRFANRIANGRFALDGHVFELDRNQDGRHQLHGGNRSTGRRNWRFAEVEASRASLVLDDPHGWMGYPGNCRLEAEFSLEHGSALAIRYRAVTDRPTPVNLAHHSYFNLDGSSEILDHEFKLSGERYLPVDGDCIPLGAPRPVAGTAFDFGEFRPIRLVQDGEPVRYDHNYCLADERLAAREVAWLRSSRSGISMTLETTEPGLQFYDGHKVDMPVPGLEGRRYGSCSGLCLEAQVWPDAPNHADYPNSILRPGETYRQETTYRFRRTT